MIKLMEKELPLSRRSLTGLGLKLVVWMVTLRRLRKMVLAELVGKILFHGYLSRLSTTFNLS